MLTRCSSDEPAHCAGSAGDPCVMGETQREQSGHSAGETERVAAARGHPLGDMPKPEQRDHRDDALQRQQRDGFRLRQPERLDRQHHHRPHAPAVERGRAVHGFQHELLAHVVTPRERQQRAQATPGSGGTPRAAGSRIAEQRPAEQRHAREARGCHAERRDRAMRAEQPAREPRPDHAGPDRHRRTVPAGACEKPICARRARNRR